jgi:outer membrane receptor protein involved in Fe transport
MKPSTATLSKFTIFFCFVLLKTMVFGQISTIQRVVLKGMVKDSSRNAPIEYATIILQDCVGKALKSTFTDSLGKFSFPDLHPQSYRVEISTLGFSNKNILVKLQTLSDHQLIAGTILLSANNLNLKEVLIRSNRPIIKQEIDGITYDMQADPESKVKSVLDMMRKIPMINIDAEDNIQLKGNANFRILINGKPTSMIARSPKDVLRSMSASNILRIEVLSTPPAKYDGEGLAGIINIITNKKLDNGYSGNVNSYYKFPVGGPTTSGSINIKSGKFGANFFGGLSTNNSPKSLRLNNRVTSGDNPTLLDQNRINNFDAQYHAFSSNLSFEIDSLNLISGEIAYNDGSYKSYNLQNTTLLDAQQSLLERYSVNNTLKNPFYGLDVSLNYELGFKKKKNKLLTLSYKNTTSGDDMDYNLSIKDRFNYDSPSFIQVNNSEITEQTAQLDYYNAFSRLVIEGGVKAIFRENKSDFQYSAYNDQTSVHELQDAKSNRFDNSQDVFSVYNSYQYQLKRITLKAGLRLEETRLTSDFISSAPKIKDNYLNMLPSVSATWKFDEDRQSFNFGYSRRIQRPNIWNLNPFVDRSNPNFEVAGNPSLRPVKSNNITLNYSNLKKISVNVGISYAFANNTIQQISVYDNTSRITRTTYDNIGKDRLMGTDFNINGPVTSNLLIAAGGNLAYVWLEGFVDGELINSNGLKGTAFGRGAYTVNKGFHLNADIKYQSSDITLQGRFRPNIYTSFSLDKDIIPGKLTASGNISNPFSKYRSFQLVSTGTNFRQTSTNVNYFRSFTFSLNYKFGKNNNTVKAIQRKINNDDSTGRKTTN